jgi:hypothetical protein
LEYEFKLEKGLAVEDLRKASFVHTGFGLFRLPGPVTRSVPGLGKHSYRKYL